MPAATRALAEDRLKDRVRIFEHLGIVEADHLQAVVLQVERSNLVVRTTVRVRIAVQRDDEIAIRAEESKHAGTKWVLPSEFVTS